MNRDDAEEYTQALGQVVAGGWRQVALGEKLGVPAALGMSTRDWVQSRLGGYVRLSVEERQSAVSELKQNDLDQRQIAGVLGVSEATVSGDVSKLKEAAAGETRTRREVSRSSPALDDAFELREGDAREVLADVPDSSVPLVLTDPPYGDEAAPLYQWLAEWAARVLQPGGSLIVYTGQSRLDRDLRIFGEHLRYWWLLSMLHTQGQRLPGKFVMAEFKPVLWYVREYRRGKSLVGDVLRSAVPGSDAPKWAQGEAGVGFLIEQLTEPGEQIVDPFAGTGEWGRIATEMGRRWLGADVAPESQRAGGVIAA